MSVEYDYTKNFKFIFNEAINVAEKNFTKDIAKNLPI